MSFWRQSARLLLSGVLCGTALPAAATVYDYRIYALGIPIGKASIEVTRTDGAYDFNFNGKFGGILAIFTGAKGTMHMRGTYDDAQAARPELVEADVQWNQKLRHTESRLHEGKVISSETAPPYTYEPEKRVPLDWDDLHDVQDPMSAMLRPLHDGKLDCTPRLRIFDGRERYDLVFSATNDPWTCHVQPIPVSGYDHRHKSPTNPPEPLEITFAPSAWPDMAVPARFVRPMVIGTVEVAQVQLNAVTSK